MKITTLFPALGVKNYRVFWITQWIALIGFWLQLTTQQWLVLGDCHRSISPFMQVVGRAVRLFASLSSQGKEPLSTDKIEYVCKIDSKLSRKYH